MSCVLATLHRRELWLKPALEQQGVLGCSGAGWLGNPTPEGEGASVLMDVAPSLAFRLNAISISF